MEWTAEGVRADLEALVQERYGRDGDVLERGYRLSFQEAGYRTAIYWWWMRAWLESADTSFQVVSISVRMDLMFRDLLTHPDDARTPAWAQRYGYSDPSAAGGAFRKRFGLRLGYVRRMGSLGRWLATAPSAPLATNGIDPHSEARGRLEAFRARVSDAPLGPVALVALDALGVDPPPGDRQRRPRYPPVTAYELTVAEG